MKDSWQFNPFDQSIPFTNKKPDDMSLDELKMLLHIQRLNIRLEMQKVRSQVNYTRMVLESAKELGLVDKFKEWLNSAFSKEDIPTTENPPPAPQDIQNSVE